MADTGSQNLDELLERATEEIIDSHLEVEVAADSESEMETFTAHHLNSWKKIIGKLQTVSSLSELKEWLRSKLFRKRFLEFDSTLYQRDDHDRACSQLKIENPECPKLPGMALTTKLHFWQPVAINAIREFEHNPYLQGGILADDMVLRKTWITIGYLLAVRDARGRLLQVAAMRLIRCY